MRILVLSDSHRRSGTVQKIIDAQPTARQVFFLGDVTRDIDEMPRRFPEKEFFIVSGNCDGDSLYPNADLAVVGGVHIFYTHGHTYGVKYGTERLREAAAARNCGIALFGHTHCAYTSYENGIWLVNPGSCAEGRGGGNSYAVIDLEPNGILPIIITV